MRWKAKNNPEVGDTRWVTRFFFFPQYFHGRWYWLEVGKVYQRRVESYTYDNGVAFPHALWRDEYKK